MEDFKTTSFKELFQGRKLTPVTLHGGFNGVKVEALSQEHGTECKPKEADSKVEKVATKDNVVKEEAAVDKNGVYIQDINGKLWKVDDWDDSVEPNAIAVLTPEHKFLMALNGSAKAMSKSYGDTWEHTVASMPSSKGAKTDYNGAYNTQRILSVQPAERYAAGWCNAYIFPDGTTNGYLPALGELYLAYQHKAEIEAALEKCGGATMGQHYYWSSTFVGSDNGYRKCWELKWSTGGMYYYELHMGRFVRPFASLEF